MGCGTSSPVHIPRVGFSLTNKPIKETHSLQSRTVISSKGSVNIDLVREFVLINHLNKEILFRLKEDSNIPKNSESEFIDLRNINQFNKSHLLLFLNVDAERDKPFGDTSDSLLKTLFDFKHLFLLADASDESVLVSAKSLLLSEDASMIANNTTNINPAAMTADSFRIPAKARTFIKHITSKGVKPKTFSIITTSYATIEQNFPNYIILDGQPKISMASIVEENNQKNKNGNQVAQGASEDNELPRDYKLLGDNAILAKTIFPRIQLPLFLYDHSDFLASNSETTSNPKKSKPPLIFVQSLPTLLSNLNSQEGVKYFLETLGIKSIVCACNEKCDFPQFKGLLPIIQIPLTNKEMKIKMMNQLFSNVQTGVSTLLVRANNRDAFLEIISVFKALLYEKFQVFTSQIQEYLTHAIPKNIAYSAVNTQSMIAKDGDNKDNGKSQQQQQINNDIFVNVPGNNKVEKEILSRVDELKEVAVKIFKENKKNKAKSDEIMGVFSQIFENIVRNPNELKYKQLKKDNKKLKETVFSTKHSDGLLKLIGFMENGEMYVNNLPATDVALIKGDLELAFKQAVVEVYQ